MRVSDIAIIFMFFSIPGPFWVPSSLDVHVALVVLLTLQSRCIQKILVDTWRTRLYSTAAYKQKCKINIYKILIDTCRTYVIDTYKPFVDTCRTYKKYTFKIDTFKFLVDTCTTYKKYACKINTYKILVDTCRT